jgi:hypothetical protein
MVPKYIQCHFPDIYDISPDEPNSWTNGSIDGINFGLGSPFDATTVNFIKMKQSLRDFFLKHHRLKQNYLSGYLLFWTTGICTTRVSVLGDSMMTSWPFHLT